MCFGWDGSRLWKVVLVHLGMLISQNGTQLPFLVFNVDRLFPVLRVKFHYVQASRRKS